jgi:hypothetical protein
MTLEMEVPHHGGSLDVNQQTFTAKSKHAKHRLKFAAK